MSIYLIRFIGQHVVQLFVQYAPYKLAKGSWDDPGRKEAFAQSCYDGICYFPFLVSIFAFES